MKEETLQKALATYLDYERVLWCHVANERATTKGKIVKLKKQGMKAGVPDILIFEPRGGFNGLAIELKVGDNKPTKSQIAWLKCLSSRGWLCFVVRDFDYGIEVITNYLNQNPKNEK